MNFDFPLILVCATALCGAIWLVDAIFLAPRRVKSLPQSVRDKSAKSEALQAEEPVYVEYAKSFFPILLIVLVLRSFLYEPFQIPSGSMLPTLKIGDFILVDKFSFGLRLPVIGTKVISVGDPERGDVMVFKFPQNTKLNYIKRVVGLPGDKVRYEDKRIYVNNTLVTEDLVAQFPPRSPRQFLFQERLGEAEHQIYKDSSPGEMSREWTVPEGHYFVMGDNRDNSNDSRYWGFVPDKLVVGKAVLVWMHWDDFFSLPSFADVGTID